MLPTQPAARLPRKWTTAEDQKLREEVEAQMSEGEVKDWCRVASKLPGRTNKDCRKRWHNSVAGGLKKGQWSKSEDLQLARGVQRFGQRWTLVSNTVQSRSADQCAKRWQQSLDPELDRSEWREHEDNVLIEAVQKLGRHWKDIQLHHFPGRSKNSIKNRYTVLLRKYQNQGISLSGGSDTPEPMTPENRLSTYSADDASSIYGDFLLPQTQASTPETQVSWSLDDESFSSWTAQEPFDITSGAPDFTHVPQQLHASVSSESPWDWNIASMDLCQAMNLQPPNSYPSALSLPNLIPYNSYGPMQTMLSPMSAPLGTPGNRTSYSGSPSGQLSGAPRSSPRPLSMVEAAAYQDPEAMSRFMRYRLQNEPPYQYGP